MTMLTVLRITSESDPAFLEDVANAIKEVGIEIQDEARVRDLLGGPLPVDIVVALSSAGVFTTLYQVLAKLLDRNQGREVCIESKYGKIILKNHSLAEEKEFIERLAPKGIDGKTTKHTKP